MRVFPFSVDNINLEIVPQDIPMMFSNLFNKIFESDEYSPTSEIFLINLFCCIFD
jgi:hypothetical protein